MKKYIVTPLLLLLTHLISSAQSSDNPCNMTWGGVMTPLTTSIGKVMYKVQYSHCEAKPLISSVQVCGNPQVAIEHTFPYPADVTITLRGIFCDGTIGNMSFSTGSALGIKKASPGVMTTATNDINAFQKIIKTVAVFVSYKDGDNEHIFQYDETKGINTVQETINGLSVAEYNARKKPQNSQSTAATSNSNSSDNSSQNSSSYHTAMNANDWRGNTGNSDSINSANQTQVYVNNAQNLNNDAIQNALAINQAKINAMKPGGANVYQRQQIAQIQQQQGEANTSDLTQSTAEVMNGLISLIGRNRNSKAEEKTEQVKRQNEYKTEEEELQNQHIESLKASSNPYDFLKVAEIYTQKKWYESANYYYAKAADMGCIPAILYLAKNYSLGNGVNKDTITAKRIRSYAYDIALNAINTEVAKTPLDNKTKYAWTVEENAISDNELDVLSSLLVYRDNDRNFNIACISYLENKYGSNYINLGHFDFCHFVSSYLWFASSCASDTSKNEKTRLNLALNYYNKAETIMKAYVRNGKEKDQYKANGKYSDYEFNKYFLQGQKKIAEQLHMLSERK